MKIIVSCSPGLHPLQLLLEEGHQDKQVVVPILKSGATAEVDVSKT